MKIFNLLFALLLASSIGYSVESKTPSTVHSNRSAITTSSTVKTHKGYQEIHTKDLPQFLETHPSVKIIDVRPVKYDDGHRIQGAVHVPAESTDQDIYKVLPNKEMLVLVYCVSEECPLSEYMSDRLTKLGYKHVIRYVEGISDWEEKGYAVDKEHPAQRSGNNDKTHSTFK